MSQHVASASVSRSTRSTVKRTLSVDDLDVLSESTSSGNLYDAKLNGKFIVVNYKRRRTLKQQQCKSLEKQSQQSQQSQPENDFDEMDVQTTDCQNLTESTKTMADLRGEIILLKDTVKT